MAALCASLIIKLELFAADRVKMVTMGEPRTGDVDFARAYDLLVGAY
jgi:hypothetical protein